MRDTFQSLKIIVIQIIHGKSSGILLEAYAYGKKDSLVGEDPIYGELSGVEQNRRRKYREFVKGTMYDVAVVKYKEGLESLKCPRSIPSKTNWRQTFHPKNRFLENWNSRLLRVYPKDILFEGKR